RVVFRAAWRDPRPDRPKRRRQNDSFRVPRRRLAGKWGSCLSRGTPDRTRRTLVVHVLHAGRNRALAGAIGSLGARFYPRVLWRLGGSPGRNRQRAGSYAAIEFANRRVIERSTQT